MHSLFVLCDFGMQNVILACKRQGSSSVGILENGVFYFADKVITPKNDRGVENLIAGG